MMNMTDDEFLEQMLRFAARDAMADSARCDVATLRMVAAELNHVAGVLRPLRRVPRKTLLVASSYMLVRAAMLEDLDASIVKAMRQANDVLSPAARARGLTHDDIAPGMRGTFERRPVEVGNVLRRRNGRVDAVTVAHVDVAVAKLLTFTPRKDGSFRLKGSSVRYREITRLSLGEWPTPGDDDQAEGGAYADRA